MEISYKSLSCRAWFTLLLKLKQGPQVCLLIQVKFVLRQIYGPLYGIQGPNTPLASEDL